MKKWILLASFLLLLNACENNNQTASEPAKKNQDEVTDPAPSVVIEEQKSLYTHPLTGLEANEQDQHRIIGVMINNHSKARPQSGLSKADIVYEVLAEGEVTRFLALFQSEYPSNIGPVRSAREYYVNLAKGYGALYICHGGSPEALQMLKSGTVDSINGLVYDGTLFKRSKDRVAPHNSYITSENIEKGAKKLNYSLEQKVDPLPFYKSDEISTIQGNKAASFEALMSSSKTYQSHYEYMQASGRYERSSKGQKTVDALTNEPVQMDNILTIEAKHEIVDKAGRRDIDLHSGGKGYLFQKGLYREITWQNDNGRIIAYENGSQVKFIPGKTWIVIVPKITDIKINQ